MIGAHQAEEEGPCLHLPEGACDPDHPHVIFQIKCVACSSPREEKRGGRGGRDGGPGPRSGGRAARGGRPSPPMHACMPWPCRRRHAPREGGSGTAQERVCRDWQLRPEQRLCILGGAPGLGNWQLDNAADLRRVDECAWEIGVRGGRGGGQGCAMLGEEPCPSLCCGARHRVVQSRRPPNPKAEMGVTSDLARGWRLRGRAVPRAGAPAVCTCTTRPRLGLPCAGLHPSGLPAADVQVRHSRGRRLADAGGRREPCDGRCGAGPAQPECGVAGPGGWSSPEPRDPFCHGQACHVCALVSTLWARPSSLPPLSLQSDPGRRTPASSTGTTATSSTHVTGGAQAWRCRCSRCAASAASAAATLWTCACSPTWLPRLVGRLLAGSGAGEGPCSGGGIAPPVALPVALRRGGRAAGAPARAGVCGFGGRGCVCAGWQTCRPRAPSRSAPAAAVSRDVLDSAAARQRHLRAGGLAGLVPLLLPLRVCAAPDLPVSPSAPRCVGGRDGVGAPRERGLPGPVAQEPTAARRVRAAVGTGGPRAGCRRATPRTRAPSLCPSASRTPAHAPTRARCQVRAQRRLRRGLLERGRSWTARTSTTKPPWSSNSASHAASTTRSASRSRRATVRLGGACRVQPGRGTGIRPAIPVGNAPNPPLGRRRRRTSISQSL